MASSGTVVVLAVLTAIFVTISAIGGAFFFGLLMDLKRKEMDLHETKRELEGARGEIRSLQKQEQKRSKSTLKTPKEASQNTRAPISFNIQCSKPSKAPIPHSPSDPPPPPPPPPPPAAAPPPDTAADAGYFTNPYRAGRAQGRSSELPLPGRQHDVPRGRGPRMDQGRLGTMLDELSSEDDYRRNMDDEIDRHDWRNGGMCDIPDIINDEPPPQEDDVPPPRASGARGTPGAASGTPRRPGRSGRRGAGIVRPGARRHNTDQPRPRPGLDLLRPEVGLGGSASAGPGTRQPSQVDEDEEDFQDRDGYDPSNPPFH